MGLSQEAARRLDDLDRATKSLALMEQREADRLSVWERERESLRAELTAAQAPPTVYPFIAGKQWLENK